MNITILPSLNTVKSGRAEVCIDAPPSKSYAHRFLIAAALAGNRSVVRGAAFSEDILATIDCLRLLGAELNICGDTITVTGGLCEGGCAERKYSPTASKKNRYDEDVYELYCRESGGTLRFLIPVCAAMGIPVKFTGSDSLMKRPVSVYREIFRNRGLRFDEIQTEETGPGSSGIIVSDPLMSGEFVMDGSISSQFVSGMLFALPLLEGDSILRLIPPVESRPYIDMTVSALASFGVRVRWEDETVIRIPGAQRYLPADVMIEGDWSNSAPFLALGVRISGLDPSSLQGDRVCEKYFRAIDRAASEPSPSDRGAELRAELDISDCPDLGPLLMAYGAMNEGVVLNGTGRLRFKESDRGKAMEKELEKFGVDVMIVENSITVSGGIHPPAEILNGHNDHRIVMALSVLCSRTGGTISGAEAVKKSMPDFFDRLAQAGVIFNTDCDMSMREIQ